MIEQVASPAKVRGETARHLSLKALAATWAKESGLSFVAPEVSFPHRKFRVDVAACSPSRKAPTRKPVAHLTSVLKTAAVFECKQCRSDLIRDTKGKAALSERLRTLESRRQRLEALLHLHLPHLANGESLFPEFDSYRLRDHDHEGYAKLMREIRISKRAIVEGTKFDRLVSYGIANLHYLVVEDNILQPHEAPLDWGILVRRNETLELVRQATWHQIGIEHQLVFLQRIAAKKH